MMHGYDGMGWWMVGCLLIFLVVWVSSIAVFVWAVRSFLSTRRQTPALDDPLDIAERRYARADISRERMEEISATLRRPGSE